MSPATAGDIKVFLSDYKKILYPPANRGYAGDQLTYKSCAPTRTDSREENAKVTGVLRLAAASPELNPISVA